MQEHVKLLLPSYEELVGFKKLAIDKGGAVIYDGRSYGSNIAVYINESKAIDIVTKYNESLQNKNTELERAVYQFRERAEKAEKELFFKGQLIKRPNWWRRLWD